MITRKQAVANVEAYWEAHDSRHKEREEVTMGGVSDRFYGRPEEDDRCYFTTRDAVWLLKADHILECLMKCGVAHFEHFDEAMAMHKREWKK